MRSNRVALLFFCMAVSVLQARDAGLGPKEIVAKSMDAERHDFEQDPNWNYMERDRNQTGDHTFKIMMIAGWPYKRLVAVNGKAISAEDEKQQSKKEQDERQRRANMPQADRQRAIQKYERDRERDEAMTEQLAAAFDFQLLGQRATRGRSVFVLKAVPKPGYRAPNRDAQVLTGMQGEMWIDEQSFQWVRVVAQVIRPVSIEGILATVEPGTRFELEKTPVSGDYWAATHFAQRAEAKVLLMFNHREHEDDTFWNFTPAK